MRYNITNKKQASTVGVKFALIPLVVVSLFAGMLGIALGAERPATLLPAGNNLFSSLRFWEKKPPPSPTTFGNEGTHRIPVEKQSDSALRRSVAPGSAPEPPPIPIAEPRSGLGHTPLPEWSEHFDLNTNEREAHHSQERELKTASHVSYSFDAREWVEFFPQHQEDLVQEVYKEPPVEIQATSLRSPPTQVTQATQIPVAKNDGEYGSHHWDGQATRLATVASIRDAINELHHEPNQTAELPATGSRIDLTPSYQKRLRYVQTCGVVVVQADFPLTEIASILEEVRMLQDDLTRYIGVPVAKEKIELCLFQDEKSYMEFLKEYYPKAPRDRRALFIKLDNKPGTLLVQKTKDFEIDLRHEMTHAIVHASIPHVPIWLDEGLAKYFEVPAQERYLHHQYLANVRFNSKLGNVPSLDRLTRLETIDDMGAKEYRDSWAWTHFLIHHSPATHRLLAAYLQMLASRSETNGAAIGNFAERSRNFVSANEGQTKPLPIPSLKLYLDDIMPKPPQQRESFREHFGALER